MYSLFLSLLPSLPLSILNNWFILDSSTLSVCLPMPSIPSCIMASNIFSTSMSYSVHPQPKSWLQFALAVSMSWLGVCCVCLFLSRTRFLSLSMNVGYERWPSYCFFWGESTQSCTLLKWHTTSKHLPKLKGLSACVHSLGLLNPVTYWSEVCHAINLFR